MSGKEKTNGSLAMAPRVITIPATSQENIRKLRVAAYARVSSNSEEEQHVINKSASVVFVLNNLGQIVRRHEIAAVYCQPPRPAGRYSTMTAPG